MNTPPDLMTYLWSLIQFGPAVLTLMACLVVGYIAKNLTPLSNRLVPLVVIAAGTVAYMILSVRPAAAANDFLAQERYYATAAILGSLLGLLTWLYHNQIWKRLQAKLNLGAPDDDAPPSGGNAGAANMPPAAKG